MAIPATQKALLQQLEAAARNMTHDWDDRRGALSFARGEPLYRRHGTAGQRDDGAYQTATAEVLRTFAPLFGCEKDMGDLRMTRARGDDIGWRHLEFQQMHTPRGKKNAIEVYGAKLAAHFDVESNLIEI